MSDKKNPFRIGIAGLGTVGAGVVKVIQTNADVIKARCGREVQIVSVIASNKTKDRGVDLSAYQWADSLQAMAQDKNIDAVVEMIGGSEGQAKDFVFEAIQNGKHVITANKALLAHHGFEMEELAEKNNVTVAYEAAIAGAIPIVKVIRESLAGNNINSVYGILNGTCNYILSEMRKTGKDFADVLQEAQDKGYAEADPAFDVDGIDAAHKLCLLGAMSFGVKPDFENLEIEGISNITIKDIRQAEELGYFIKLIGMATQEEGVFIQTMAPCLVPIHSQVGQVEDVFNCVQVMSDGADKTFLEGRGAGELPTASSVLSDVVDLARGNRLPMLGCKTKDLKEAKWKNADNIKTKAFIRIRVKDDAGVIADITSALKDKNVSIDTFIQKGHDEDNTASVAIVTQKNNFKIIQNAVESICTLDCIVNKPTVLRIAEI